jgi:hypothetical protein
MYHYETLGDERFQQFCQALICEKFPNAQCLPVGQPDGGRDAFVLYRQLSFQRADIRTRPEIIVFQVKYTQPSGLEKSERRAIEELVISEKKNLSKLKELGLMKYYFLTNVRGTSHLGHGSIDRVNDQLTEALGVDSYCWWRDDLDRRLDSSPSIKWSFPEVLKATDVLGALVKGLLGEEPERRQAALRAYLTTQYDDDKELKFKQTELRSTMTDLFVDLPMQPSADVSEL